MNAINSCPECCLGASFEKASIWTWIIMQMLPVLVCGICLIIPGQWQGKLILSGLTIFLTAIGIGILVSLDRSFKYAFKAQKLFLHHGEYQVLHAHLTPPPGGSTQFICLVNGGHYQRLFGPLRHHIVDPKQHWRWAGLFTHQDCGHVSWGSRSSRESIAQHLEHCLWIRAKDQRNDFTVFLRPHELLEEMKRFNCAEDAHRHRATAERALEHLGLTCAAILKAKPGTFPRQLVSQAFEALPNELGANMAGWKIGGKRKMDELAAQLGSKAKPLANV